jgi:asparagine synthase (glutamine-hydrolysing)
MCGIAVTAGAVLLPEAEAMAGTLRHRGPDAVHAKLLRGCAFGHARLSIIDLATGDQPMSDSSGRYWITFNGEIYNYRELRAELEEAGCVFRTHSDTEVVVTAWREWGAACLDRLRGMFALAIWDEGEQTLFAARDLFGEKPLYYISTDTSFAAASELKALVAARLVEPRLDLASVDAFLALGWVPPDRTIYRGVATLPPAHYLTWKAGTGAAVRRYWSPKFEARPLSMVDAADRLRELIEQAVQRQMVADVPVGAFLSGGLDSSTIVALMQQHSPIPVKTFSVGFGSMINELPYARAVAKKYGTEHHEIDLATPDVAPLLEKMCAVYDEPFADTSHIPTYLISEFARRSVKVVLSGDGGDELFGGYGWHRFIAAAGSVPHSYLLWMVTRLASKATGDRNAALHRLSIALGYNARWPDPWMQGVHSHVVLSAAERRAIWRRPVETWTPAAAMHPDDSVRGLDRAFHFDLMHYLPGDILVKVDRAAMAHGLETRAPFLDRDLAEFALALPASLKVDGAQGKRVLREACNRYWPEELRDRPKQGFGSPIGVWMAQPEVEALRRRVTGRHSRLQELLPGAGRDSLQKRNYRAWILLTLGLWLDRHEVTW